MKLAEEYEAAITRATNAHREACEAAELAKQKEAAYRLAMAEASQLYKELVART